MIEISEEWNLGEITRQISTYISDEQTAKLNYALNIQEELNDMLIKGFGVETMIERMSRILGVPVLLFNPFYMVDSQSWHYQQNNLLKQQHIRYFLEYLRSENANTITRNQTKFTNDVAIFKVQAYAYFPYYLMVSDINRFFESLITNRSDQSLSVHNHTILFEQYGIYPSDYYQVIICAIDPMDNLENSQYVEERYQFVYTWLIHKLTDLDSRISVYSMPSNRRFAILLQSKHEYYLNYLKHIQQEYHEFFDSSISFGIGNRVTEFSQLSTSFMEANEAYESGLDKARKAFMNFYQSKSMKELLQLLPPSKLKPFIQHTLGDLAYPKTKKDEELKDTLKMYMNYQCDITKTAKKMFIHRNTVKYLIKNCEEILGCTVEDSFNSLNIRLVLYASEEILFDQ